MTMTEAELPAELVAGLTRVPANTLKHNDTFGVFDSAGDILPSSDERNAQGIFHSDTRHLSQFVLTVNGQTPELLSAVLSDDNTALTFAHTIPGQAALRLNRIRFLLRDTWFERIELHNAGESPAEAKVTIRFASDFVDIFQARGAKRKKIGRHLPAEYSADTVTLAYIGLDNRRRCTCLRFSPVPALLNADTARFDVSVPAGGAVCLHAEIVCEAAASGEPSENFSAALAEARRERKTIAARAATIVTASDEFNQLLHRTRSDLTMLLTETPQGPYPYAGIPWYSTAFGRDGIITAMLTLWMDPQIALGTLGYLAALQAQDLDPAADAEPGKILHETRKGEMAETGEVPFRRYYGSVDSTPLFIMLAGMYLSRTGDIETIRRLWPAILKALGWLDHYGDSDGDGICEYDRQSEDGLSNQGWKDSQDSIFHADGSFAQGSIALCEAQAYAYEARLRAAEMCRAMDMMSEAAAYEEQAVQLRERVETLFWSDRLNNYVLALDGAKKQCEVQASNAGHLLFCCLPTPERAAKVAETLMSDRFYSGWGIRTIAEGEARYDERSYHNGSVWPHDNALAGMGFGHYGFRDKAARVLGALYDASRQTPSRRLPELFAGFRRVEGQKPVPSEEIACSPQAWVTATPLGLLNACLGLGFDPSAHEIYFENPYLPEFVNGRIELHNLRLGHASIDVALTGSEYDVQLQITASEGPVNAVIRRS